MPYINIIKANNTNSYLGLTDQGQAILLSEAEALQWTDKIIEIEESVLLPGLMDTHIHGHGGYDFSTATTVEEIRTIMLAIGKSGVAYAFATLVSLDQINLERAIKLVNAYLEEEEQHPTLGAAKITGIHLEGPWISESCKGAHDVRVLRKDIEYEKDIQPLLKLAPKINCWKMTFSPDIKGAAEFVQCVKEPIELDGRIIQLTISLGHTNAAQDDLNFAIEHGATSITHLGNACCENAARCATSDECRPKSNLVTSFLSATQRGQPVVAEVIVDGRHTSKFFVSHIFKESAGKIMLVSDSLGPSGLQNGLYKLGSLDVWKKENHFFIIANENINPLHLLNANESTIERLMKTREIVLAGSAVSLKEVCKEYYDTLKFIKEDEEKCIEAVYQGAVVYPRESTRCIIPEAVERENFILMQHGKILLSCVQGQTYFYDPMFHSRQYYKEELTKPVSCPHQIFAAYNNLARLTGPGALKVLAKITNTEERLYTVLRFLLWVHRLFPTQAKVTQRNFTIDWKEWGALFDENILKTAISQLRRACSCENASIREKRFAYAFLKHDSDPLPWKREMHELIPHLTHSFQEAEKPCC